MAVVDLAADRVSRARSALLISQPFFGTLALHLDMIESDQIETTLTNGRQLFYNPAHVDSLSDEQLKGALAHNVMHCAFLHHTRRGARDARLWNEAGDYCINPNLLKSGFRLPPGALVDDRYDGLTTDEIYRMLEAERQENDGDQGNQGQDCDAAPGGGQGPAQAGKGDDSQPGDGEADNGEASPPQSCGDPGRCGEVADAAPEHDASGGHADESKWQARVRQAMNVAKAAGRLPGGASEIVDNLDDPRIDWRAILRRFIDDSASRDYAWTRPNKRHLSAGYILPGYVPDRPSHIVAMIDTSGSITNKIVESFGAELQAMLDEGACDRITVAYADTKVHKSDSYDVGDIIEAKAEGRGGTAFREPLAWVGREKPDATAIVYMTDLEVKDWGDEPAAPIMWLACGEPKRARQLSERAPFGEPIILSE